jgi:[ribosomal protein S5]-alanine N-acetyltransferase
MAFLRSPFTPELPPVLLGTRTRLRTPEASDYAGWAALRAASRDFLSPWEPTWPVHDLTRTSFRLRIKQYLRDIRDDLAYPFFIFSQDDGTLLGGVTLSNIRRGVAQMGTLGYWIGAPHAGKGYMTDALRAILPFAFDHLTLHRVEAACLPHNAASVALLRRCGFEDEGRARAYLKINGEWQDHLLFARLQ